ncbi:MAG: XrtN system VIT domain-containing protein, partial [Bacteroidetes bacterium]|nr:XrtN system VIT domain-containing protein [Bacteroidota bacterium]
MNTSLIAPLQDKAVVTGILFLILSLGCFVGTANVYNIDYDLYSGIFFLNFGLTVLYLIIVFAKNKSKTARYFKFSNFKHNVILLQLFNVSAYSLNRSIPVFQISANWVVWFLLISNGLLLVHALWRNYASHWLNHIIIVVANVAILFHLYESIYIAPISLYAALGFWLFAIPLHAFVPALFVWTYFIVVRKSIKKNHRFWSTTLLSWMLALFFIGYVSIRFHQVNITVKQAFHHTQKPYQDNSLPAWLTISQTLQKDWITERALKCGLTYSNAESLFRSFGDMNLNERIKHDPLVVIASFFSSGIDISANDKVKILRYMYDARHQSERKLWSGDNLSTSDIVTNVQLFPQYRLAYTEKTFKIKNSQISRWRNSQEALYTFYLPEGSVVTSAALWVNGKEEPAYLTTKEKADNAYKTIVGRERRDPLLLHWQEGNRVTVRVFPCTSDEDRQFKIGVTTPLRKEDNRLTYENIDFEGPYWKDAIESINVVTEGALTNVSAPFSFRESGTSYTYLGNYKSDWHLQFDTSPLSETPFSFNGKTYRLLPFQKEQAAFDAQDIYLDINAAWSKKELNSLWKTLKSKKVFIFSNNRMEQVTEANKTALFKQMRRQNFTLFPFYKIAQAEQALVISKFNQLTPTLSDL